jgi:divalent metal cation (Fe/Co/Zn/Cd) transporter
MTDPHLMALRRAARLTGATVLWNLSVGGAAVATAVATGSLSLIGFGINAVVDSSVSCLLVWRFSAAARGRTERADRVERLAVRVAGAAFAIVAIYLSAQGARSLLTGRHPDTSLFGIVEALAALAVLPYLAAAKYRLSRHLGSRGLRADSLLTGSGIALAVVALASLLVQRATGWRSADAVGALLIAAALAWQSSRSLRGQ